MSLLRRTRELPDSLRRVVHAIGLIVPIAFAATLGLWSHVAAAAAIAAVAVVWFALRAKSARVRRWDERHVDAEHYDAVWSNPDAFTEDQRDAAAAGRIPPR